MLPPLNLHLYRTPPATQRSEQWVNVFGKRLPSQHVQQLGYYVMDATLDQLLDRLAQEPRLFIEPDGSFVWTGSQSGLGDHTELRVNWQLDGMLYDNSQGLVRVELMGCCPQVQWQKLIGQLQPDGHLIAHLLEPACFVLASDLLVLWNS